MNDNILLERAYSLVKEEQQNGSGTYDDMNNVYAKAKELLKMYNPNNDETYFGLIDLLKDTYFMGYKTGSENIKTSHNIQ